MVFVLPVCQTVAKSNFPIFTLIQNLTIKKPAEAGFFANCFLPEQKPINVWRTADDDVLYADRLFYVQPDERHE
ncbi:hypothetical protein GA486_00990 [Escherichia coli]|nr:hypothetical protein [Escherichia coli]EEV6088717.1 hypothetical protein [Escherichia coli]EEV7371164.1 hypothetical protein [Escherichia coli]EEW0719121.1 hypothetical protein [Escherichia coli]EEW7511102.1 hypothetical protein [Escherichia coli]